jgi:hypothetical protein
MRYQQICPVSLASEVIAERWTPLILREIVLFDRHHFSEIQHGVGRISRDQPTATDTPCALTNGADSGSECPQDWTVTWRLKRPCPGAIDGQSTISSSWPPKDRPLPRMSRIRVQLA